MTAFRRLHFAPAVEIPAQGFAVCQAGVSLAGAGIASFKGAACSVPVAFFPGYGFRDYGFSGCVARRMRPGQAG